MTSFWFLAAVAAAKAAFEGPWRKTSYVERAALLDMIADGIAVRCCSCVRRATVTHLANCAGSCGGAGSLGEPGQW